MLFSVALYTDHATRVEHPPNAPGNSQVRCLPFINPPTYDSGSVLFSNSGEPDVCAREEI